ncbi:hypothetical protein PR003_g25018 [Phytophthora rubi]|uniref:DDE Tnp4 domain-containing protein n=1 Tax=Phytophthora rubi TaxID=129364 RepID=A0A6A3ID10_9STRA|nr:hypothetical protein PR002_g24174 [Phytophthora rubi]KAE9291494.1 hypothetical protein PR003_g25018 [Phytophthora rubi]
MDRNALIAVVAGVCMSAAVVAAIDKRSIRAPPSGRSTFSNTTFEQAMEAKQTDWFHKKLRCDKKSFLRIYKVLHAAWGRKPGANSKTKLIKRIALAMIYLSQGGTMDQAASTLGISRPRAVVYINEMLDVLKKLASRYIAMPTPDELPAIEAGFEAKAGFPDVIGAVDGTLVAIPRPRDFEGWYCRKGFPAVNVQAVVDDRGYFRSISIRAGSNNDQSLWNGSGIKKRISSCVPPGKHLLADAGYKIWGHLLTPFPEVDAVGGNRLRLYNWIHSRTRITVECAFGRLKNRFRLLLGKLEQKTSGRICKVILGCIVLHNLLILVKDPVNVNGTDPLLVEERPATDEDFNDLERPLSNMQGLAKREDLADAFLGSA